MKKRRKKHKRRLFKVQHIPRILFFLIFSVIVLGFLIWLLPFTKAEGINRKTLGEDNITDCPYTEVINHGPRDKKEVALTFDADMTYTMEQNLLDGSVPSYINRNLLTILEQTNTKATLFLSGLWIRMYPKETKALGQNRLFELANHSYSHPTFEGYCYGLPQLGTLSMQDEIMQTQKLLKNIAGVDNIYFRFPGGCVSVDAMNFLSSQGMKAVNWDVVGGDGFNNNTENIMHNVIDHVQNGSIIVLHMNGEPNDPKTTEAIPTIISELKSRGFEFVKLSELLQN